MYLLRPGGMRPSFHAEGEVDLQPRVRRAGVFADECAEWQGARMMGPVDRRHTERRTCSLAWRVDAGQGCIWGHDWCPRRGWQRYSTEVQQLTWTRADLRGRGRTVTCTDGRGWTCCRQMACKRSAVRARLAPTGQRRNSNGSNSGYSSKVQQRRPGGPPYVCSDRASCPAGAAGRTPDSRRSTDGGQPCHLRKSTCHRSRDSCHLVTTRLSWMAIPAGDCCRICK